MRVRPPHVLTASLLLATLVACTSPQPDATPGVSPAPAGAATADGGTFTALLDRLPGNAANGKDEFTVVYGDLDRATADAGLTRPTDAADPDAVISWLNPITGVPRDSDIVVRLADSFAPPTFSRVDEFEQEVGWSVVDARQYVEVQALPQTFLLATTTDDLTADLDAAQGPATDGIWGAAGEDFHGSLADATPARPQGLQIRVAQQDGLLAASRATPPLRQWLADGTTLADDPTLAPIATVLDGAGVYTAMIVTGTDFSAIAAVGPTRPTELAAVFGDDLPLPFSTVGVGLSLVDGSPVGTIVLSFSTAQAATDSLAPFEAALIEGTSVTGRPVADNFQLTGTRVDGNLLVATVTFEGSGPAVLVDALMRRDLPFVHG